MKEFNQPVYGMTCQRCVDAVHDALRDVPGVDHLDISLANSEAKIISNSDLDLKAIKQAITQAGYKTESLQKTEPTLVELKLEPKLDAINLDSKIEPLTLNIHGMHCASCVTAVEKALLNLPDIKSASVNLLTETALITPLSDSHEIENSIQAIRSVGYDATLYERENNAENSSKNTSSNRTDHWQLRTLIAFSSLLFVLISNQFSNPILQWLNLLFATITQVYVGWPYYQTALIRLIHGAANMDTLVAIGSSVSFTLGLFQFFTEKPTMALWKVSCYWLSSH